MAEERAARGWRIIDALILGGLLTCAKLALDAISPTWWVNLGHERFSSHLARAVASGLIAVPVYVFALWLRRRTGRER